MLQLPRPSSLPLLEETGPLAKGEQLSKAEPGSLQGDAGAMPALAQGPEL